MGVGVVFRQSVFGGEMNAPLKLVCFDDGEGVFQDLLRSRLLSAVHQAPHKLPARANTTVQNTS